MVAGQFDELRSFEYSGGTGTRTSRRNTPTVRHVRQAKKTPVDRSAMASPVVSAAHSDPGSHSDDVAARPLHNRRGGVIAQKYTSLTLSVLAAIALGTYIALLYLRVNG